MAERPFARSSCFSGRALKANATLTTLELECNQIGDEGMKALMAAARGGALSKLKRLDVDGNQCGQAYLDAIAEAIEDGHLPSLEVLVVNTEDKEHPRLKAACKKRRVRFPYDSDDED